MPFSFSTHKDVLGFSPRQLPDDGTTATSSAGANQRNRRDHTPPQSTTEQSRPTSSRADEHDYGSPSEETPPPLPPRPKDPQLLTPTGSLRKPQLQASATTAVSLTDIHTSPLGSTGRGKDSSETRSTLRHGGSPIAPRSPNTRAGPLDDNASVRSVLSNAPTLGAASLGGGLFGDLQDLGNESGWRHLAFEKLSIGEFLPPDAILDSQLRTEFSDIEELNPDASNQGLFL